VPEALEPLQAALTPADRLVRVLDPIVLAPAAKMGDAWQHGGFRGRIARQPVGHDRARHHPKTGQEFAKEALRGLRTPAVLDQDVEHLTRVIDGPRNVPTFSWPHLRSPRVVVKQSAQTLVSTRAGNLVTCWRPRD
jgi:hypothetical protein